MGIERKHTENITPRAAQCIHSVNAYICPAYSTVLYSYSALCTGDSAGYGSGIYRENNNQNDSWSDSWTIEELTSDE